jgi:hypothetical protein
MKTKYTMLAAALAMTVMATAQELDDMYFNARDRVVLAESNQAAMAVRYAAQDQKAVKTNPVNPSDSYTGRGVNPEFSAQQKNGAEIIQNNPDYFLSTYAPKDVNGNLYSGNSTASSCGCNTGSAYSSMAYSGFGNPYGNFYSPYGYGGSPYTSMGYGYNGYSSMMSMSIGFGSMYSPYYGGMYSPYSMYSPYGYSGYGNPYTSAYVTGADVNQTTYGRRPVRASSVTTQPFYTGTTAAAVTGTNGRTRATAPGQSNYYDPSWRSDPTNFPTRSFDTGGRSTGYTPAASTGRTWGSDAGRSRSYDSFGSGSSRSSVGMGSTGSSSGGSSSGGRSRGRN